MSLTGLRWLRSLILATLVVSLLLGCARRDRADQIQAGMRQDEVREILGEPSKSQQFVVPEDPYFGPQESLLGLVPAGTSVEEWQYDVGDDVLYVWFALEATDTIDVGQVIAKATFPEGVIY